VLHLVLQVYGLSLTRL
jgi:hypothetical protein